ncbi:MAG: alkaline phosphatase family protein [Candidatus Omnitrophota bacterium]
MQKVNSKLSKRSYNIITSFVTVFFLIVSLSFFFNYYSNNYGKNKVLLICVDGATWHLIKPLINENELPNFRKLIENGASGILFSKSAYSPPCWTSIATGKESDKHGVRDFSDTGKSKCNYLWDILSKLNIKVGVFNWLASSVKEINGVIYRLGSPYIKTKCYPSYLKAEIDKAIYSDDKIDWRSVELYKLVNRFERSINSINYSLINKFKLTFIAWGIDAANPYQHRYWSALEPQYFDISFTEVIEKGSIITDYYKKIDSLLSYFIKRNYTIFFVSDHGFSRNDMRSGPRIIKYQNINSDMQHVNFLMNILLEKVGLLSAIPKPEGGGLIDFQKSKAYFYNSAKRGVSGIKINKGITEKNEVIELKRRILSLLKEACFETGEKVFLAVEEMDINKQSDLPDITFRLSAILKEKNIFFKQDIEKNPQSIVLLHVYNNEKKEIFKIIMEGKEYNIADLINYSHDAVADRDGVIIMSGKNIRKKVSIETAQQCDITPTILYLLGLPVARDMDGGVLFKAIEPSFIQKYPCQFIETYEDRQRENYFSGNVSIEDEIDKEKLHSLGYIQ